MSYKTYNNYKDSKIDWIKEIPNSWSISRVKNISLIKSGESPNFDDNGQYDVIGANGKIGQTNRFNISTYHIIIGRVGASGSVNISPEFAFISDNAFILTLNKNIDLKYSFYLFKALDMDRLINKNAQPLLTATQIKNLFIPYTTLNEQKQIANYLDKKTAKIDATIAKNEELIELLEEKRVALINQVVTKGLNPDVPMKDSGVEWIGEIPEHWDSIKLKYCAQIINDKKDFADKTDNYIGLEHIESETGKLLNYSNDGADGAVNKFKKDMVLFGKLRPYLAKVINTSFDGVCSTELLVFKTNESLISKYLFYFMLSHRFIEQVNSSTYGVKMPRASPDFINSLPIALPNINEQKELVDYLDYKMTNINSTISKIRENIALLEEYKTSLIHHVVTGKIDVRGEEI